MLKKSALVIGNGKYANTDKLKNPANDAVDVAKKLTSYGFNVISATDITYREMEAKLSEFKAELYTSDVGLFFFAGHGIQIDGENFLLSTEAVVTDENDVKFNSLKLSKIIHAMDKSAANTKIIILDACRENPWENAWSRSPGNRGLASVYAPKGTLIAFATSPGQIALDGSGRNGTYTEALLQHIDVADLPIENMFKRVRNTGSAATKGKQITWEHTSLSGNFYFNMGLGQTIKDYPETSLADSLFVLDESRSSHKIIRGLKSHTYGTQNEAIRRLEAASVKKMHDENLFVLGRNIYQAACGGSFDAEAYINTFLDATSGYPADKRKAILDGMLFEIFFDKEAKLRSKIKGRLFNSVFDLQKHASLKGSFDFIANACTASQGDFYVLPGSGRDLAVTVVTTKLKNRFRVASVYVDTVDVLRPEDEEYATDDDDKKLYKSVTPDDYEDELSIELMVPRRLLHVAYNPAEAKSGTLGVPIGYTVRKA